jgi:hypothetical protein
MTIPGIGSMRVARVAVEYPRLHVGHDSNYTDSGNDCRASTIVAVAQRVPDVPAIVDELLMRICSLQRGPYQPVAPNSSTDGELPSLWANVFAEAENWWEYHRLDELPDVHRRSLTLEILGKAPLDAAVLLLGVFSQHRVALLERRDIEGIQLLYSTLDSTHRTLAHALSLLVLAPWFAERQLEEIEPDFVSGIGSGSLNVANSLLVVCLGLLQIAPTKYANFVHTVLLRLQVRSDLEDIDQLGGLLERLWPLLPEQVEMWLSHNCQSMPRKVFRLAVERMPSQKRAVLTQQWKARRVDRRYDNL